MGCDFGSCFRTGSLGILPYFGRTPGRKGKVVQKRESVRRFFLEAVIQTHCRHRLPGCPLAVHCCLFAESPALVVFALCTANPTVRSFAIRNVRPFWLPGARHPWSHLTNSLEIKKQNYITSFSLWEKENKNIKMGNKK